MALDLAQLGVGLVGDEELLHRSVRPGDVKTGPEGRRHLSSTAFNDPAMRPSVDRAILRDVEQSKQAPTDGVCGLVASEIRSITDVIHQGTNKPYNVDVVSRPVPPDNPDGEPPNPAHAQVEVDPNFESPSRFKRLKDSLCRIAETRWLIEPS